MPSRRALTELRIGLRPPARPGSYARRPASASAGSGVSIDSGLAVTRLNLADHFGHELGRPRPDVHVNICGPFFVLHLGDFQNALDVAGVEELFGRRHRIVDCFADNREVGNGHGLGFGVQGSGFSREGQMRASNILLSPISLSPERFF